MLMLPALAPGAASDGVGPAAAESKSPWVRQQDPNVARAFLPQMIHCARDIGIDPSRHSDFLWIAEAARDAVYAEPLPAPWRKTRNPKTKAALYVNPLTQQVMEVHPAIPEFQKLFRQHKKDAREAERTRGGAMRRMTADERATLALDKRARKFAKQETRAALRLQKVFRGKRCRMQVDRLLARRQRAATVVQAGFRGMGGRRRFWGRRREWAATVFQKRSVIQEYNLVWVRG